MLFSLTYKTMQLQKGAQDLKVAILECTPSAGMMASHGCIDESPFLCLSVPSLKDDTELGKLGRGSKGPHDSHCHFLL